MPNPWFNYYDMRMANKARKGLQSPGKNLLENSKDFIRMESMAK